MTDIFKEYRFNEKHHLGLGDIRLTIAQQNEINDATQALLRVARAAYAYDYCNDDDVERKKRLLLRLREAIKEAKHLL